MTITFTAAPTSYHDHGPPVTGGSPASGATVTTPRTLAVTGLNLLPLLLAGGMLVAAGAIMVATTRTPRRRGRHQQA